jgi:hypothetical protein
VAIINLILFFGYPETTYYTVPVLIIAKLYCNTLLVLFNSRMRIVGGREEDAGRTTIELPTGNWQGPIFTRPPSAYVEDYRANKGVSMMGGSDNANKGEVCFDSCFFYVILV